MTDLNSSAPNDNHPASPVPGNNQEQQGLDQGERNQQDPGPANQDHGDQNQGPQNHNEAGPSNRNNGQEPRLHTWRAADKHKNPELVKFFNGLGLRARLEWNKERERKNAERDLRRINNRDFHIFDVSDDDSIFSLPSEDYEDLCDPDYAASFSDSMPDCIRRKLNSFKKRRQPNDPSGAPPTNRRRMDGDILKAKDADDLPMTFPDIYYTTEDERAFLPLSFFHPDAIRYVATNLATIPLTRINPRPGEPKGRVVLDITRLSEIFGDDLSPSFTYDKYLESTNNYIRFQSSRDISENPLTPGNEGGWSKTWFNHFTFFQRKKDTGTLFPFWKAHEHELRHNILVDSLPFRPFEYEQHFLIARSGAQAEAALGRRLQEMNPSKPSPSQPSSSNQFFRSEGKPKKRNGTAKPPSSCPSFCLACAKDHTVFVHISRNFSDSFEDGKPSYCHVTNGKLLLPDGTEPCFLFNLANFTNKSCPPTCARTHACTFCGGPHPAFGWSCRRSPNAQS